MGRNKLQAALQKSGGARSYVNSDKYEKMNDEQLRLAAYESRRNQDIDITTKMSNDNRRNTLLQKAGFDWYDIDELTPHPDNAYHIDDESINNLAGLIYNSKTTEPLILRETEQGIQILDGERRWRAHRLLAEKYGEAWRMVPGQCHPLGTISDEDAEFILHSNNMGQRDKTPSERALGFKVIADRLVEWRKDDPSLKGVKTKTVLAQHFGVSERTAMTNLAIARGLSDEGKMLLDSGKLTMEQAESVSRLPEDLQRVITKTLEEADLESTETTKVIEAAKSSKELPAVEDLTARAKSQERKRRTPDDYLKTARNALKKAERMGEPANFALIGEIKQLIRDIERQTDAR